MVDQVITRQDLIDAHVDAQALEDIVNDGPEIQVQTRLGRLVWTLATLEQRSLLKIQEWQNAIDSIVVDSSVPDSVVVNKNGETQEEINSQGGATWYAKAGGYNLNDRVILDNGDIVKSTVANNIINPNVDVTGWVKTNNASQIFDASGVTQQDINDLTTEFKATTSTELNLANFLSKADFQKLKNLDRSLDISDYLNSILTEYSSKRTDADDTYSNAQGILKINLPKGVYEISNPIVGNGVYGLILEGAGVSTTSILYKKDTGDVFSFTPYLNVTFKNMSIIHQPISPVKSTWNNSLFKLNGFGGGRRFETDHVLVVGFNKVFDFVSQGNANEDTTHCMDSQFMHCNTFIYSRSSQAVNNSFGRCGWYGDIKKVFDVSNYGHTHIYDSGVVIAGAFFSLASHAGFYGKTAQFLMTNVKFEWLKSDLTNTNATTKIIETADDPTISAYFKLINCGIAGGSPDPSVNSFDIRGGNIVVDVGGGEWVNAKIATKAVTSGSIKDLGWIKFKSCAAAPLTSINRISGASGAVHKPVIFENCTGTDNITLLGDSTVGNGAAVGYTTKNINNLTGNTGRLCTGAAVSTHSSSCYGQQVYVDKVQLLVKSSTSVTNAKAKLYFDSAKAVLIGEIPITAQPTPQIISFTATGFTNDGVYVEISQENANAVIIGHVRIESSSI